MATRTLTWTQWLKLMADPSPDVRKNVAGYPAVEVAARLGVSRARVYQLIESDALDIIEITTRSGKVSMSLVTDASLERYLSRRVPDRGRQGYFAFPGASTNLT